MNEILEQGVHCPYCSEHIDMLVDASVDSQDYIEDCQVCCRPIRVQARVDAFGNATVSVAAENE